MQKHALTNKDLITRGRVSSPFAAFSAAKGKIVKASVADKKPAISEKRVAM